MDSGYQGEEKAAICDILGNNLVCLKMGSILDDTVDLILNVLAVINCIGVLKYLGVRCHDTTFNLFSRWFMIKVTAFHISKCVFVHMYVRTCVERERSSKNGKRNN